MLSLSTVHAYAGSKVISVLRKAVAFLRKSSRGQDLAEYSMLVALVALAALGLVLNMSGGIQGIWQSADKTLAAGNSQTGGSGGGSGSPASAPPAKSNGDHHQ
jgi:Flp pilus assembly pilin Flp